MNALPSLSAGLPDCHFKSLSSAYRLCMLWCCFASSVFALQATALSPGYQVSLLFILLGYSLYWHFRLRKDPAVSFRFLGNGGLACFEQGWQRIESMRYRRWPFCIVLDYRHGQTRKQVVFLAAGMPPNVRRGLFLALAECDKRPKKLPAILTNPVL